MARWVGLFLAAFAAAGLAACGGSPTTLDAAALGHSVRAQVIRAVDGDTALVRVDGHTEYVRYIGVDTPETVKPGVPVQCFGERASHWNHRQVDGRSVRLVFDAERRDKYGRLLAYVHRGRQFLDAALVRKGYARPLPFPPNTSHAGLFARLAQRAADDGRGLWGKC